MRLLVLGGTVFLGRHVAAEALARGHELTLFTRGIHGAELFPEAERLRGDRSKDVSALRGREFDAVIDTCGYKPADVAASAGAVDAHYVFVSSCNAYPGWPAEVVDEDTPAWDGGPEEYGPGQGPLRAGGRGGAARPRRGRARGADRRPARRRLPAAVVGAADRRGRRRARRPATRRARCRSSTRATSPPGCSTSPSGASPASFNGTGPAGMTTMGELLGAAVEATGSGARLRWIPDAALRAAGVEPWTELPLWAPEDEMAGTWLIGTERAQAAGLRCRPGGRDGRRRRRAGCATAARPS